MLFNYEISILYSYWWRHQAISKQIFKHEIVMKKDIFHSRKCIRNCRLQNEGYIDQDSID